MSVLVKKYGVSTGYSRKATTTLSTLKGRDGTVDRMGRDGRDGRESSGSSLRWPTVATVRVETRSYRSTAIVETTTREETVVP